MFAIWHFIKNAFLGLSKKPSVVVLWLAFPLVIATMMYLAFGGPGSGAGGDDAPPPKGTLLLIDYDQTGLSSFLATSLERQPLSNFFDIQATEDSSLVRGMFEENEAAASLVIPSGFQEAILAGSPVELPFTRNPRMTFSPQMAASSLQVFLDIANHFLEDMQPVLQSLEQQGQLHPEVAFERVRQAFLASAPQTGRKFTALGKLRGVDIAIQRPSSDEPESMQTTGGNSLFALFIPGLMIFGLMFVGEGFEKRFATERRGVLVRARVSPVRPIQIAVAHVLVVLLAILLCATLILALSVLVYRIRIYQPFLVFLLILGFGFTVVGFFKSLYSLVKNDKAVAAISSVAIIVLAFLGGGMIPAEAFPEGFRNVSGFTPLGGATQGLVHALARGHGLDQVGPFLLRTWIWGAGLCLLAFVLSRKAKREY